MAIKLDAVKVLMVGVTIIACQGEDEAEVLVRSPQPEPAPLEEFYGDVTTVKEQDIESRRFAFKVIYEPDKKPVRIVLREIKLDGETFSDASDCIDTFDYPSIESKEGYYEIKKQAIHRIVIMRSKKTGKLVRFYFSQKHNNKWLNYNYSKKTKGDTASHEIENTEDFDQKYFSDDIGFCEDSSPSTSETNTPQ